MNKQFINNSNLLAKCCQKAEEDGIMDEASMRLTVTYMLLNQAFAFYDDAVDILETHGINMGKDQYLVNRVIKAFDEYFSATKKLMPNANPHRFASEYDKVNTQIEAIVKKEMSCWDDEAEEGKDYKICELCGKRKNLDEMSKSYKHRCKSCVAAEQRKRRQEKDNREERIKGILAGLDRKKMQARQIYPRTMIVPYDRATDVIKKLRKEYEGTRRN